MDRGNTTKFPQVPTAGQTGALDLGAPVNTNTDPRSSAPALEQALHHSRTDAAAAKRSGDGGGKGVRGAGVGANSFLSIAPGDEAIAHGGYIR